MLAKALLEPRRQRLLFPMLLSALLALPAVFPESWLSLLEYRKTAIAEGQAWRLISGHLIHLSNPHLLMNLVGYWLIWQLFFRNPMPLAHCIFSLALLTLGTSAGLSLYSPEIAWYRGFSGVLHGLLVWGLLREVKAHPLSSSLLLGLVVLKLLWEQIGGALPGSEAMAGGRVIVAAHLYGAIIGALLWPLESLYIRLNKR